MILGVISEFLFPIFPLLLPPYNFSMVMDLVSRSPRYMVQVFDNLSLYNNGFELLVKSVGKLVFFL